MGVAQWKAYDGPWELPEDLQHQSMWAKYVAPAAVRARWSSACPAITRNGGRPSRFPERAIGTSVCEDEFCALDPTATGETLRWIGAARLLGDGWRASLWAQYYDWNMLSNATYDFQINQFDRRWIGGGRYQRELRAERHAGADRRRRDAATTTSATSGCSTPKRAACSRTSAAIAVTESSVGAYSEAQWQAARPAARDGRTARRLFRFRCSGAHAGRRRRLGERQRRVAEARRRVSHQSEHRAVCELGPRLSFQRCARRREHVDTRAGVEQGTRRGDRCALRARHVQHHDDLLVAGAGQRAEVRRRLEFRRARCGDAPPRL